MSWIRKLLIIAVVILVAFLTAFFVFKNPAPVSINFIVVDVAGYSIAMWLVLSFFLGAVLGLLAGVPAYLRYKASSKSMDRKVTKKDREIQKLKGEMLKG